MKNYPGRTIDEILGLAYDISTNYPEGLRVAFVENAMLPWAEDELSLKGDYKIEGEDYYVSTVAHCAVAIAQDLDNLGYVDVT